MSQAPGPITLGVVRQQQIYACAVVFATGEERSLLPSPSFMDAAYRPRSGDLVAVQDEQLVYCWQRAVVLRTTPGEVEVMLEGHERRTVSDPNANAADRPLRTGDPVFVNARAILARAWTWYEQQVPPPGVQERVEEAVRSVGTETAS